MTDSPLPKPALAAALHAIEITRTGVTALEEAALHGPLGEAIDKAIGIIAEGKGRLIVTGIGKSGHTSPASSPPPSPLQERPPITCIPPKPAMATSAWSTAPT